MPCHGQCELVAPTIIPRREQESAFIGEARLLALEVRVSRGPPALSAGALAAGFGLHEALVQVGI
jgi:hypothetical protein